jgi:hypothetical protein
LIPAQRDQDSGVIVTCFGVYWNVVYFAGSDIVLGETANEFKARELLRNAINRIFAALKTHRGN